MTFEDFLCGIQARDYAYQDEPYEQLICRSAKLLREADRVLIGAGAGMSAAAGAVYGGEWFKRNFAEFVAKYGGPYMEDAYSAGFYPYPTEEGYWGYWSKQCLLMGIDADYTPLHRTLLNMLSGRQVFCLSTNGDEQFEKAGMPSEAIFATQGDYSHIQCAKGCHPKRYNAVDLFRRMDAARKDCLVPPELVPKCPVCGGRMNMNLRIDGHFVQDAKWYEAEERFGVFLTDALKPGRKLCLLEVGVGFNTPTIIRFPFEQLMREHPQVTLVRLNLNDAFVPRSFGTRAAAVNADMKQSIEDIAQAMR